VNLLGISWGMGARDVGMKAAMSSAQSSMDKLNDTMETQSKIAKKSDVPGFFESIKQFNIASIASDVRSLTGDTGNLTNSLEAMAVANAKAAKPFVASLNLTGKEARRMTGQISSMAISLNVGAETVAKVFKGMNQATGPAKEALDALGYSAKDWVKITETTGIEMDQLTDAMGGLGAWWQASAADEVKYINRLTDLGRKAGVGVEPLKKLKGNLEGLAKTFEKVPPEMRRSGDEMMALTESTVRLSGAFRSMGSSEEEAVQLGQQTAQMFADQAVAIERAMKYGIGSLDDSPLFQWMTKLGVGMDEAVNIIEVGSRDAVKGTQLLQGVFDRFGTGGAQQQAMLSELSGALGEAANGLGYLAQRGDSGAKALERVSKITSDGKFSLKDYANQAFSTGRTLQESMDLMKSSFETKFRAIARKDVVRFVGDMGRAYNEVAAQTKQLASDETWGPLIKRLSAANQLGFRGLIMDLEGSNKEMAKFSAIVELAGSALGSVATSAGPVMSLFGQLSILTGPGGLLTRGLGGFIGKLGLIGLVIGGVVVGIKMLSKRGMDLGKVFSKALDWVGGLAGKIRDFLAKIDWAQVGKSIGSFVWNALTFIPKAIWGWITGKEAEGELGKAGTKFIENLGGAIWEAAKGLGKMLWGLGKEVVDSVSEWWDSWTWEDVKDSFSGMGDSIKGWWDGLQKDPEFSEFKLNVKEGLQDAGWAIEDWWYNFKNNFDDGMEHAVKKSKSLVKDINLEGAGEDAGSSLVSGIANGIRASTAVSQQIALQSVEYRKAALNELATFDSAELDTSWATTTAKWIGRARDSIMTAGEGAIRIAGVSTVGLTQTIAGMFGSGMDQASQEGDVSISRYFSNMLESMRNYIHGFALKVQKFIQEVSVGLQDIVLQLAYPEYAEKKGKELEAKLASERAKDMQDRLAQVKEGFEKHKKNWTAMVEGQGVAATGALEAFGIGTGADIAGEKKGKKQVEREQKWMAGWQAQADKLSVAAHQEAEAKKALSGLQGKDITTPEGLSALTQAETEAAKASAVLKGVQAQITKSAGAAGIKDDALTVGVKKAMDLIIRQEEVRAEAKIQMEEAQQRLTNVESQAQLAAQAAAQKVSEAFGQAAVGAMNAGAEVSLGFAGGMTEQPSIDAMVKGADIAAQTVADRLTSHSPILDGPLANVGAGGPADPAFNAGMALMESFASGITTSVDLVTQAVNDTLDASVYATFDAYKAKMEELARKKSLLADVANMMMRDFGGSLQSTVTVEGKTEDVKAQMRAMLNIPGMAGVTMAIINESAKQRAILDKIRANTETIAKSDLITRGKVGSGGEVVLGG